jgi:hypothetical protein
MHRTCSIRRRNSACHSDSGRVRASWRSLCAMVASNRERPLWSVRGGRNHRGSTPAVARGWLRPSTGNLGPRLARSKSAPNSPAGSAGVVRERSGVDHGYPKGGLKASRSWVGVVGGGFKPPRNMGWGRRGVVANLWRRARGSVRGGCDQFGTSEGVGAGWLRPVRDERGGRCGMVATSSDRPRGLARDGCDHLGATCEVSRPGCGEVGSVVLSVRFDPDAIVTLRLARRLQSSGPSVDDEIFSN